MQSPSKRQRTSSPTLATNDDFVPLGGDDDADESWQAANGSTEDYQYTPLSRPPREPTAHIHDHQRRSYDPRNEKDKPKSKHVLPGCEPWILVKTKFRRRFVHNTQTKESFWRIPNNVWSAVQEFERSEREQKEKKDNAQWAEEQLKQMRLQSKAKEVNKPADEEGRSGWRRSESLQREDEEAMMAALAAQAEHAEEEDAEAPVKAIQPLQPQSADLESDSEYEVVEVTDSEGEEGDEEAVQRPADQVQHDEPVEEPQEDGPVEFGEDDIAWQLAQMGEEYGLDDGEYGEEPETGWEEGAEGLGLSSEDAANLFRDLLYDYHVSPFTPWEKIVSDESEASILNDDRYTVLPNMKARREVFDIWARDRAAELKAERAAMENLDPKIPYLAFLEEKATPKLYWPEFKRKYKRDGEMNERKLSDKDREKLYRDHISRLKLSESTRKADLQVLLKSVPLKALNRDTRLESLPQQLLSHLHFISLPKAVRDRIVESHIKKLPPVPEDGDLSAEQLEEDERKREERRRRQDAMAERQRKVDEERRRAEKDEIRARRNLREEERELQRAMALDSRGLQAYLS